MTPVDLEQDYRGQLVMRAVGWSADQLTLTDANVHWSPRDGAARPVLTRLGRMIQPIHSALIREATNPGS
jgi:hypothetical protein